MFVVLIWVEKILNIIFLGFSKIYSIQKFFIFIQDNKIL